MDGLPAAGEKNFRPDHEKTSKNLTKPWETESSTISSEVSKTDDQKKQKAKNKKQKYKTAPLLRRGQLINCQVITVGVILDISCEICQISLLIHVEREMFCNLGRKT